MSASQTSPSSICNPTPQTYPYAKLASSNGFRILKLFPRGHTTPASTTIYGTLSEHLIDDGTPYECLSYTWGSQDQRGLLWLDGCPMALSWNLTNALRRLQHWTVPRRVWIDYICINQNDVDERTQQVRLMYRIYSGAFRVIAYIGEDEHGSQHVPDLCNRLRQAEEKDGPIGISLKLIDYDAEEILPRGSDEWTRMEHFVSRPWFRRVWIIQEALAGKEMVVTCGRWTHSAHLILSGCAFFASRLSYFSRKENGEREARDSMSPGAVGALQISWMMKLGLLIDMENARFVALFLPQYSGAARTRISLLDGLEGARVAESSDPRDKVFALLNLCHDASSFGIEPDYSATTADVFRDTARALIQAGAGGRLLINASEHASPLNLPSWVPDWTIYQRGSKNYVLEAVEERNIPETYSIRLTPNALELSASVVLLGTVRDLAPLRSRAAPNPKILLPNASEDALRPPSIQEAFVPELRQRTMKLTKEISQFTLQDDSETDPLDSWWCFQYSKLALILIYNSPRYEAHEATRVIGATMISSHSGHHDTLSLPDIPGFRFEGFYRLGRLRYDHRYSSSYQTTYKAETLLRAQVPKSSSDSSTDEVKPEDPLTLFQDQYQREKRMEAEFQRHIGNHSGSSRLTCTDKGFVGMVPPITEQGDIIVCLKDVSVPFVLRHVHDRSYKIMGHAFFDGFMPDQTRLRELQQDEDVSEITLV